MTQNWREKRKRKREKRNGRKGKKKRKLLKERNKKISLKIRKRQSI